MAASDYDVRGNGAFASVATLSVGVGPLDDTFSFSSFSTAGGDTRVIGEGIMLGNEIMRLTEIGTTFFKAARGCADTIPASHAAGSAAWFYETNVGSDLREYVGGETVGVKVLPFTTSSAPVPIENSPPNTLAFNWRFGRPYPPGFVRIATNPWFSGYTLDATHTSVALNWVHRNRITQADQLIDHMAGSISPEDGTTYKIRVYRTATNTLVRTVTGIVGASYTVTLAQGITDTGVAPGMQADCYMLLNTVRDGLDSLQTYRFDFTIDRPADPYGLGYRLGESLGGVTP